MIDLKPYRIGKEKVEEYAERLSRWIENNPWLEILCRGGFVTKHEKATINANTTLNGTLGVTGLVTASGGASLEGGVVINDAGGDFDTRIESDGNANMLFVDAGNNRIGIGEGAPGFQVVQRNFNNTPTIFVLATPVGVGFDAGQYSSLALGDGSDLNKQMALVYYSSSFSNSALRNRGALYTDSASEMLFIHGTSYVGILDANGHFGLGDGGDWVNVDPQCALDFRGEARFGDGATNYSKFETDGTLAFVGNATVWEDLRIEPIARSTGTNVPAFEKWFDDAAGTSRGVYLYSFDDAIVALEKELHFQMQMPHAWKGTAIYIHVHWVGDTADTNAEPRWGLEYAWSEIGADYGDTTTVYSTGAKIGAGGATDANVTAGRHYISKFASITPSSTQDGISSILIGRIFRNSSDAADTYDAGTNKCGLLYIDAHYEVDTCGSRSEYTK